MKTEVQPEKQIVLNCGNLLLDLNSFSCFSFSHKIRNTLFQTDVIYVMFFCSVSD